MNIPLWLFPALCACVQAAAMLVYLSHKEWRLAILWGSISIANAAMAGIK